MTPTSSAATERKVSKLIVVSLLGVVAVVLPRRPISSSFS